MHQVIDVDRNIGSDAAELALDIAEFPGPANNPRIVTYRGATKLRSRTDDGVPGCSSFVNDSVKPAVLVGTDSQTARTWERWGSDVTGNPREGAIAVFSRTGSTTNGGHVGFFESDLGAESSVLGGNEGDRIVIGNDPKEDLLGRFDFRPLSVRRA